MSKCIEHIVSVFSAIWYVKQIFHVRLTLSLFFVTSKKEVFLRCIKYLRFIYSSINFKDFMSNANQKLALLTLSSDHLLKS